MRWEAVFAEDEEGFARELAGAEAAGDAAAGTGRTGGGFRVCHSRQQRRQSHLIMKSGKVSF